MLQRIANAVPLRLQRESSSKTKAEVTLLHVALADNCFLRLTGDFRLLYFMPKSHVC